MDKMQLLIDAARRVKQADDALKRLAEEREVLYATERDVCARHDLAAEEQKQARHALLAVINDAFDAVETPQA